MKIFVLPIIAGFVTFGCASSQNSKETYKEHVQELGQQYCSSFYKCAPVLFDFVFTSGMKQCTDRYISFAPTESLVKKVVCSSEEQDTCLRDMSLLACEELIKPIMPTPESCLRCKL